MSSPINASAQVAKSTVSMVENFWAPFLNVNSLSFVLGLWIIKYAMDLLQHWDQSAAECTSNVNPKWCYKTVDVIKTIIQTLIYITVLLFIGGLLAGGFARYGLKPQAFTQALGVLAFFYLLYLILTQWSGALPASVPAPGSTVGWWDLTRGELRDIITTYSVVPMDKDQYTPVYILMVALVLVVLRAVA